MIDILPMLWAAVAHTVAAMCALFTLWWFCKEVAEDLRYACVRGVGYYFDLITGVIVGLLFAGFVHQIVLSILTGA